MLVAVSSVYLGLICIYNSYDISLINTCKYIILRRILLYTYFYNHTMRNVTIAIANIIKDIKCVNYDVSGNFVKDIPIPCIINVPEKDYMFKLINHFWDSDNVEHNQRYYQVKPRTNISFQGMSYDNSRQSDSNGITEYIGKSVELSGTDVTSVISSINPSPWNFEYLLEFRGESWLHLTEFLEQFLVFFNPCAQISVKELDGINISRDLKVSLTNISFNINSDLDSSGYKQADCSIGLSVEGFLYRPISSTSIIKTITTNYYTSENS